MTTTQNLTNLHNSNNLNHPKQSLIIVDPSDPTPNNSHNPQNTTTNNVLSNTNNTNNNHQFSRAASVSKINKVGPANMSSMLAELDFMDRKYSDIIHKWEWGLFDILVIIPGTIFGVWGVPFLVIWYFYYYQSPLFFVAVVVTTGLNEGLKNIIKRVRPDPKEIGKKIIDLRKVHNNPSMPSGDTAQASVMAVTLLYHGYSWLWLLVVPVGAFGRIYFGSHFIGDCVIGAGLGAVMAYMVNWYMFVPDF